MTGTFKTFLLLCLCLLGMGTAHADSALAPAPALSVVAGDGVRVSGDGTGLCEMPPADPAQTPVVTHEFTLKNTTSGPVSILHLRAACGCTTMLLTQNGSAVNQVTLAPGKDVQVRMSVRIAGQEPGEMLKYGWAYGNGPTPLATLAIGLTIRPAFAFAPANLDFGSVALGTARSLPLVLTADDSALTGGKLPVPLSSDPNVRVAADGPLQAATRDHIPSLSQKYEVSLAASTPVGRIAATVFLPSPPLAGHAAPPQIYAAVTAQVTGHLSATPAMLFFGSLPAGQKSVRRVLLSVSAADADFPLTITSQSAWVSAATAPGVGPSGMELLEVTLSDKTPVGPLQAQVTITDHAGERLQLPVIAQITPAGTRP